jgi:hypothetical protein
MGSVQSIRSDGACVVDTDGSPSNAALHEQMTDGVDDSDIRARTRVELYAAGVPAAALNRLFPDIPPLPEGATDAEQRP